MSNRAEREAEDQYEAENEPSPVSADVPVQSDQAPYWNTDQQLADDKREAINKSNILRGDRLRHAKPQTANKYNEGPAENYLPDTVRYGGSGASSTRHVS
ncbi:hypothetical protein AARAC_009925 [Aspergillus arachidicola]|uniref:Uncharacterized protein n=1 Tax=Aspergillus arachidicola TaxID=656916 RepID=A0A2G7FV62_9EURO|nr:hypothetical protein AARAC_009925 [Aspergillus arachidicola]